jgi:hypothetical protein
MSNESEYGIDRVRAALTAGRPYVDGPPLTLVRVDDLKALIGAAGYAMDVAYGDDDWDDEEHEDLIHLYGPPDEEDP